MEKFQNDSKDGHPYVTFTYPILYKNKMNEIKAAVTEEIIKFYRIQFKNVTIVCIRGPGEISLKMKSKSNLGLFLMMSSLTVNTFFFHFLVIKFGGFQEEKIECWNYIALITIWTDNVIVFSGSKYVIRAWDMV